MQEKKILIYINNYVIFDLKWLGKKYLLDTLIELEKNVEKY